MCGHELEEVISGQLRCIHCKKYESQILREQLAAANARVAELEYKLTAQTETALQEKAKREQEEAQNKRMQTAINRYVIGNIELLDAMKAALEDKP